jgi:hypothetical protein
MASAPRVGHERTPAPRRTPETSASVEGATVDTTIFFIAALLAVAAIATAAAYGQRRSRRRR